MNRTLEILDLLYKKSQKKRILSDQTGKIHWHNMIDNKNPLIYFPDEIPDDITDGKCIRVSIDNDIYCGECTIIYTQDDPMYLWTISTMAELLYSLGYTDTYTETSCLITIAKTNINEILRLTDAIAAFKEENYNIARTTKKQTQKCCELLEQVEVINELTSVMYGKAPKDRLINVCEEINTLINQTNLQIESTYRIFSFAVNGNCEEVYVKTGLHLFRVMMLTIIKKILKSSTDKRFGVLLEVDKETVRLTIPYTEAENANNDSVSDEFEIYVAKLYAKYIGGSLENTFIANRNAFVLTLKRYQSDGTTLHSNVAYYDEQDSKELAKIFLYSLIKFND